LQETAVWSRAKDFLALIGSRAEFPEIDARRLGNGVAGPWRVHWFIAGSEGRKGARDMGSYASPFFALRPWDHGLPPTCSSAIHQGGAGLGPGDRHHPRLALWERENTGQMAGPSCARSGSIQPLHSHTRLERNGRWARFNHHLANARQRSSTSPDPFSFRAVAEFPPYPQGDPIRPPRGASSWWAFLGNQPVHHPNDRQPIAEGNRFLRVVAAHSTVGALIASWRNHLPRSRHGFRL